MIFLCMFIFTPMCLQKFFKHFLKEILKNMTNLIEFNNWNRNSSTAVGKTQGTHRLGSGVSRASLWSLWDDSEGTIWRTVSKLGTSDWVAHSHYDSNFAWTRFQEFQCYDFQITIAVLFHTGWMSAVFLKGSSNLLALVFQSSGLERSVCCQAHLSPGF